MKALLATVLLLVGLTCHASSIYDSATSQQPQIQSQLVYKFGSYSAIIEDYTYSQQGIINQHNEQCTVEPNGTFERVFESSRQNYNNAGVMTRVYCTFGHYEFNGTEYIYQYSLETDARVSERSIDDQACLNPPYTLTHNGMCYDPTELELLDTCNQPNIMPAQNGNEPQVCYTKQDGSQCLMNYEIIDGQNVFTQSLEPESCYQTTLPDYNSLAPNFNQPTGNDCQHIGGGISACPENPLNVCDENGTCQTGCGYVGFNGVEQFICFSQDTDGDGIGNYADLDIDGDGIPNTDDPDVDGDGIPNEQDDDYTPSDNNQNPIQPNQPVNVDVTVDIDEQAIGQAFANELIEQVDFDTSQVESEVAQSISNVDSAIDNVLTNESFQFQNVIDQTTIASDMQALSANFASTQCALAFDLPVHTGGQIQMCSYLEPLRPILGFFFAIGTAWLCFTRVTNTIRES